MRFVAYFVCILMTIYLVVPVKNVSIALWQCSLSTKRKAISLQNKQEKGWVLSSIPAMTFTVPERKILKLKHKLSKLLL